ncbi:MAG TPA: hypothetical protein VL326_23830, partial [Kofleriaceae bacterium]|nr:hypothetical protein [Kofleriaceae bacterium]
MNGRCLVLTVLVLAACKSNASKTAQGSAAAPQSNESQPGPPTNGGEVEATAEGGPAKTTPKGAAYLAQLATHLEQKLCRCADQSCLTATQATIAYDATMDSELGPADRARNEWLKNREAGCIMRVNSPDDAKELIANVPKAQKERDEALAAIASPYTIETTKPKGKAELERYDALRKAMCACTTAACVQKLMDQESVNAEAMVDMTDRDRDRYS